MNTLMTQAQLADIKARVLFRDFEKINSVMAGRTVKVQGNPGHSHQQQPPAWSEVLVPGKNAVHRVTFSTQEKAFDVNSVEGVVGITGLNYHELAHVLYTQGAAMPHMSTSNLPTTALRNKVENSGDPRLRMIRAVLEDMRIERKFIAEYGPTKPYFQSVVGRFLLGTDDPQTQSRQFLLLAARTYVDKSIRDAYRQMFVEASSEKVAKAYSILANQFAELDFDRPRDILTGFEIIQQVSKILGNKDLQNASKDSPFHGGTENIDPSNNAGDEGKQEEAWRLGQSNDNDEEDREDAAKQTIDNADGEEADGEESDGEESEQSAGSGSDEDGEDEDGLGGGDGDDEGEEGEDEGTGSGSGTADEDDEGDFGDGDGDDDSEGEGAGETDKASSDGDRKGNGVSKGEDDGDEESDWDSNEQIKQMVNRAENNESVLEEVAQKQRSLRSLDRPGQSLMLGKRRQNYGLALPVESEMQLITKRVSQEFRQLQVDLDPGRKPYQPSGVVSMKRAMKGVDYDTVFDSWDEGQQDASDMEVVLLTDMSASMSEHSAEMSRAVWVIQRAIQMASTSSVVSVVGYGTEAGYLQDRGNRVSPNTYPRYSCGDNGTSPRKALEEAVALFATTKRQKRVLIVLTDGMWDEPAQCDSMFQRMNEAGVVTSTFLYLGGSYLTQSMAMKQPLSVRSVLLGHHARIYQESNQMSDLIGFAKKVVTTAMKEN